MRSKMRWGDFVIIAAVLLAAAALAVFLAMQAAGDRLYAEIWKDGELTQRVALTPDTRETIDLDGHNTIVLDGLTARMAGADCRDQVCVRTGTLSRAGQAAVCLPNRVVLKLVGEKNEVDAIVS
ncbi:NusG domain II-containing protein [Butyricicoccus faecihominis]|uniref:NusG domain II-containing protein n=2 Tax=Butyricicoccaceae TaxID=3085642 RepID=UPI00295875D5|nr:NusG domain II-containing protein [Agathobaculum sp. NTUH-O15-33]MCQ5129039.1 NusG domain II-containing protein [Butyricicoccus faecihominis]WNX83561.1 NusG domain II-containing protein [Agathobaculum sp. NTUH-O15-33]